MTEPVSWVVGRGGLLGRSVEAALAARGRVWHPRHELAWDDPGSLASQLVGECRGFRDEIGSSPWQVAWCAGAGTVGSGTAALDAETDALRRLLDDMARAFGPDRMKRGALFMASSAGGVYAGSSGAPFDESSAPRPLSPYGRCKLSQESLARRWSNERGVPVLIGRISNLYGPDQNLSKAQGVITEVCSRVLTRQPLMLYVPLDTIRDYLYVSDAARLVADGLRRLREAAEAAEAAASEAPVVVKVLASQQPVTVATVLGQVRRVTKRPVSVVIARSPNARHQVHDLRMASNVWPELDRHPTTTLGAGIHNVFIDLVGRTGHGWLPPSARAPRPR